MEEADVYLAPLLKEVPDEGFGDLFLEVRRSQKRWQVLSIV